MTNCECGTEIISGIRCLDCFLEEKKGINNTKKTKVFPLDFSGLGLGGCYPIEDDSLLSTQPWIDTTAGTAGLIGTSRYYTCGTATGIYPTSSTFSDTFSSVGTNYSTSTNCSTGLTVPSNHTFATPLRKYK